MSKKVLTLLLGGMGLVLVLVGGSPSAPAPDPPALDLTRPEAWPQAVAVHQNNLDRLAQGLILVAQDEKQPSATRKQAIFALGRINNRRSLTFLLDHLDYNVSFWEKISAEDSLASTSGDQAKGRPCEYALLFYVDWNVVPLILERLDQPRKQGELATYSGALDERLGGEGTAAIIAAELSKRPKGARKQNLQTLKGWYQQHHHFLRDLKEP